QDLGELRRIRTHGPQVVSHNGPDLDALGERVVEDRLDLADDRAEVQGFHLPVGSAGHGQEPLDHLSAALGAGLEDLQEMLLLVLGPVHLEELDRHQDGVQQVVEVVRDAPRQGANTLQPLRAQELGLQLLPGRDVGIDRQLGLGVALRIPQEDPTGLDDDLPAVPGYLVQLTTPAALFEHGPCYLGQVHAGVPEKERIDVLAEDLLCRQAVQLFRAAVPEAYPVVQAADQDGVGYLIQQGSLFPKAFRPLTCEAAVECRRPQNQDSREAVHHPVPEGSG